MKKPKIVLLIVLVVIIYILGLVLIMMRIQRGGLSLLKTKAIGVIEVEGCIGCDLDAKTIVKQLKSYGKNPFIKVIVLRIESPGGGVSATQEIYNEINKTKAKGKKIVVSMGSVAASGGYYIACPADIIVANPGTLTGSIGVIMEYPMVEELLKKLGISYEVIKSREHKDIGSPFRKMTEKERRLLSEVVTDIYQQFVDVVSQNRNLPKEKVLEIADGRILSGHQAQQLGLVDSLGSYEDAIKIACNLAGISGEPHIIKERPKFTLFRRLFSRFLNYLFSPIPMYLYRISSN
ncbi:MAG: signal peptide peptidase SppA [candidate division WOR-3 bacterium]|nr:signal peptide peptidase SppA [candidate division WOR-3 bacterium]